MGARSDLVNYRYTGYDWKIGWLFIFDMFPGIPDFAEVYGFIGSVFDPDTSGHVDKLKEMDPINFETVSLLQLFSWLCSEVKIVGTCF